MQNIETPGTNSSTNSHKKRRKNMDATKNSTHHNGIFLFCFLRAVTKKHFPVFLPLFADPYHPLLAHPYLALRLLPLPPESCVHTTYMSTRHVTNVMSRNMTRIMSRLKAHRRSHEPTYHRATNRCRISNIHIPNNFFRGRDCEFTRLASRGPRVLAGRHRSRCRSSARRAGGGRARRGRARVRGRPRARGPRTRPRGGPRSSGAWRGTHLRQAPAYPVCQ